MGYSVGPAEALAGGSEGPLRPALYDPPLTEHPLGARILYRTHPLQATFYITRMPGSRCFYPQFTEEDTEAHES